MQLESHATPVGVTPQQRYASLHRAIEQGIDSDDVWRELAEVSASLGHKKEAERCVARIRHPGMRTAVEERVMRITGGDRDAASRSTTAPAPGSEATPAPQHERHPGVADHLADSMQYMLHQHMPWLVLTTTLAFPLLVGVGGFLTVGGSPLLLAAIAALPGLSVLAVVAAMARQILLTSSEGVCDVPNIPGFANLVHGARRFSVDLALTVALFVLPPALLFVFGAPLQASAPSALLSALFAPIAFGLRSIRGDMRAFSPTVLLRAVRRCGRGYPVIALVTLLLFAPAGALAALVHERPIWVQIAMIGPLGVLPCFVACRLLGSWLDTRRVALGDLLRRPLSTAPAQTQAAQAEAAETPARQRQPRRPEALDEFQEPSRRGRKQPQAMAGRSRAPVSAMRHKDPTKPGATGPAKSARAIEGRRPSRPAQQPAAPAPRRRLGLDDQPDLSQLPGSTVVTGEERARTGAAARTP